MFKTLFFDGNYFFFPTEEPEFEGVGEVQLGLLVLVKTFVGLPQVTILCDLTFISRRLVAQNHGQ